MRWMTPLRCSSLVGFQGKSRLMRVIHAGAGVFFSHGFADGVKDVTRQGTGEALSAQFLALELAGGLEAHSVGFEAFVEMGVLPHAEALGQFLVRPGTGIAVAFQFQALEIQALGGSKTFPMELVETARDEVVGGDLDGAVDHLLELGLLIPSALAEQFMADIHALDVGELSQHAQGGGIGSELVVGVAKVGFGFII